MSEVNRIVKALETGQLSRRGFIIAAVQLGLSVTAIAALLEACGSSSTSGGTTPKSGGKLTVGFNENLTNLDPHLQSGVTWSTAQTNIWEGLTGLDPVSLKIVPRLATDWKLVDPTTASFTLRSGVKFHNGAAFTASDVQFTIQRIQDAKTGSFWAAHLADVASVQVQDPTHVNLILSKPLSINALTDILREIYIVSAADGSSVATTPNGTGPFKYAEWQKNNFLRIVKNASYWSSGQPYLDEVTMKIISDAQALIAAVGAGDVDALAFVPLKDVPRVRGMSGIQVLTGAQQQLFDVLDLNRTIPPFNDAHLRRMVMYAFDRQTYFAQFLGSQGVVQTIPFLPNSSFYANQDANAYPFDLNKAKQELAAAGYGPAKPLSFGMSTIASGFPEWENASVMLQASLKQIGVTAQIRKLEIGTWVDELFKSTFTLTFDFLGGCDRDPYVTFIQAWALRPGKSFAGTTTQEYTDLLDKGSREPDTATRKTDYQQAARINNDELYSAIIGLRNTVAAVRGHVHDYHPHTSVQFKYTWRS